MKDITDHIAEIYNYHDGTCDCCGEVSLVCTNANYRKKDPHEYLCDGCLMAMVEAHKKPPWKIEEEGKSDE